MIQRLRGFLQLIAQRMSKREGEEILSTIPAKIARTDDDSAKDATVSNADADKQPSSNQKGGQRRGDGRNKRGKGRGSNSSGPSRYRERADWGKKEDEATEGNEDNADKAPRQAKRKVALLMSFCGTGYQGMQMWGRFGVEWQN